MAMVHASIALHVGALCAAILAQLICKDPLMNIFASQKSLPLSMKTKRESEGMSLAMPSLAETGTSDQHPASSTLLLPNNLLLRQRLPSSLLSYPINLVIDPPFFRTVPQKLLHLRVSNPST